MRTITLEEHFATPRFLDGPGRDLKEQAEKFNNARELKLIPQLCDLGDKRIAEMDAGGIDMQIVSLTAPGVEQLEAAEAIALAADTNDFVADAIKKHPARFGGFAALPTAVPDKAAQELERRVRGQKFAGAIINGHWPLSRRQVLLADPGKCRTARRTDLPASSSTATARH